MPSILKMLLEITSMTCAFMLGFLIVECIKIRCLKPRKKIVINRECKPCDCGCECCGKGCYCAKLGRCCEACKCCQACGLAKSCCKCFVVHGEPCACCPGHNCCEGCKCEACVRS